MWGGFQEQGMKTIIPARAHAKISCRLVPREDMNQILDKIEAHLRRVAPEGVISTWRAFPRGDIPHCSS
jgi:acetylornithine deacetylase/succinyl-diaminopimelate desuccinylase-like protein